MRACPVISILLSSQRSPEESRIAQHRSRGARLCEHAGPETPRHPGPPARAPPGRFGQLARPRVHESPAVRLTAYPGTVRQLIVTGLGHDQPTVIITNDHDMTTRAVIGQYARRMTIEQRLAEIIRAFCADALSSTVNLNVDLDIMLAPLAQALLPPLRSPPPGYHAATPDVIQRRFLETPGQITTAGDTITVRLERRAYSPVLRKKSQPAARNQ